MENESPVRAAIAPGVVDMKIERTKRFVVEQKLEGVGALQEFFGTIGQRTGPAIEAYASNNQLSTMIT